jgi:hypothetical protein
MYFLDVKIKFRLEDYFLRTFELFSLTLQITN